MEGGSAVAPRADYPPAQGRMKQGSRSSDRTVASRYLGFPRPLMVVVCSVAKPTTVAVPRAPNVTTGATTIDPAESAVGGREGHARLPAPGDIEAAGAAGAGRLSLAVARLWGAGRRQRADEDRRQGEEESNTTQLCLAMGLHDYRQGSNVDASGPMAIDGRR